MKKISITILSFILLFTTSSAVLASNNIANRLKGHLLLQVEDHGRIWYVDPANEQKHEVTFANALNLFETLALGISNDDLNQIPIDVDSVLDTIDTDNDGYSDRAEVIAGYNPELASNPTQRGNDKLKLNNQLANRLKGKFLLQVEDRGRIWYVDQNGNRHEVTWKNLMNLFKRLALGISNNDLNQITADSIKKFETSLDEWLKYTDPQNRFIFYYPSVFGELAEGFDSGFQDRVAAISFSKFSSGIQHNKIVLEGEAVLTKEFIMVDADVLGGLYDTATLSVFPDTTKNIILAELPALTVTNFCDEISKENHIDLSKSVFDFLNQQDRDSIIAVDQMHNINPKVISCNINGDTVTFHKEATYKSGQVENRRQIYGAINFLKQPFSSFQLIRITTEAPTQEILDTMTAVVNSFE